MLLLPYSSMYLTILERIPVRIEAMTITTITPMTTPSTVRKLLNLLARMLSIAIKMVSLGMIEEKEMRDDSFTAFAYNFSFGTNKFSSTLASQFLVNAIMGSNLAALNAGYIPAIRPMTPETPKDKIMYPGVMVIAMGVVDVITVE